MSGDEDIGSGLMAIALSDSDAESGGETKKTAQEKRTGQSEVEFHEVKRTYKVKVENGQIWKTVQLPLPQRVLKPETQTLIHAVEELYFFRRFSEGARLAKSILDDDAGEGKLDEDAVKTLAYYEKKCLGKQG
ncbi:hypothetical protein GGS20DRAFT_511531 [Poronia punctata]|nr:hypothetical protein GGS20DRAFT_511531 [Poronia punctata]